MKRTVLANLCLLWFLVMSPVTPPAPTGSSAPAVFVGTSPCADFVKPLLKIPLDANCDRIKWNLTLDRDLNTGTPTTYKLTSEYGFHVDNRTYEIRGTSVGEGKWAIVRGAKANPDAMVFQLNSDKPQISISFLKVDQNILHLLDRDGSLVVGNAAQSFTLSRSQKAAPPTNSFSKLTTRTIPSSSSRTGSSILGVFVGRSPCRDVARQINRPVNADCIKVKWELMLYQDPNTLSPTSYKLKGTFFRERIREGKWTIVRGTRADPNAIVYQLDTKEPQKSLFLLKADDNILFFLDNEANLMVGDAEFSYTLNRTR